MAFIPSLFIVPKQANETEAVTKFVIFGNVKTKNTTNDITQIGESPVNLGRIPAEYCFDYNALFLCLRANCWLCVSFFYSGVCNERT